MCSSYSTTTSLTRLPEALPTAAIRLTLLLFQPTKPAPESTNFIFILFFFLCTQLRYGAGGILAISHRGHYESYFLLLILVVNFVKLQQKI